MRQQTVVIVDYGMGNLRSVAQAVQHVADSNIQVLVTADAQKISEADRVIFPGQGAARDCMSHLQEKGRQSAILNAFDTKPFLGICMGLEVLLDKSDENGGVDCLGVIPGRVRHFQDKFLEISSNQDSKNQDIATLSASFKMKVPHMGWNHVTQKSHVLWQDIDPKSRFYFCHSYYVEPSQSDWSAGVCDYGFQFAAALAKDNVFAVQFHPEKSAHVGLQLLKNFLQWEV